MTVTKYNITDGTTDEAGEIVEKKNTYIKMEETADEEDEEITLEDLAPDGGWGWIIAFAIILIIVSIIIDTLSI